MGSPLSHLTSIRFQLKQFCRKNESIILPRKEGEKIMNACSCLCLFQLIRNQPAEKREAKQCTNFASKGTTRNLSL